MEFKKWCSIENSYRKKHIAWYLETFPELLKETYVITEKIHGSNFQWLIQPNKPIQAGSRNMYLDIDGSFQGASIANLLDAHAELLRSLQYEADDSKLTFRLFGELFGKGIGKGVDYGEAKRLLYFGLMINDVLIPFERLEEFIPYKDTVPVIDTVAGLDKAMSFATELNTALSDKEDNLCEGVVIQPYGKVYQAGARSPFMLKKKNQAFEEKTSAKTPVVVPSEVQRLNAEFVSYITDNRLQSVFSKHGEIAEPKQIGGYIRLVLDDAKADFIKDHGDAFGSMPPKEQKAILNVGSCVANMLKGYL